jgi:HEAT repeat protein
MVPVEEPVGTVTAALLDALDDKDPAVRVAAADAVARLGRSGMIDGDMNDSQAGAVERLIETAWAGEGQQARAMGRALCAFGAPQAQAPLLARLDACKDSAERRFAIEMLDELLRPADAPPS